MISKVKTHSIAHAYAAWIGHVVQMEAEKLSFAIKEQDINKSTAMHGLQKLREFVNDDAHILGNSATKHGEIAEAFEVYVGNAMRQIKGNRPIYVWLGGVERFAPADYLRNGREIQSKFINGTAATVRHLRMHLQKYPNFIERGGCYHIPRDRFSEISSLLSKKPSELVGGELTIVRNIQKLERDTGICFSRDVKPTIATYAEVQKGQVGEAIDERQKKLENIDKKIRKIHSDRARPTLKAGLQAAALGAMLEGSISLVYSVAMHRKNKKSLADLTADDWGQILSDTNDGLIKGGIRGGGVYISTKIAGVPAPVAVALTSVSFGVMEQVELFRKNQIDALQFLYNAEDICFDISISAISSAVGQAVIPVPVLGALIGNTVGTLLLRIAKNSLNEREQFLIEEYLERYNFEKQKLDAHFAKVYTKIKKDLEGFEKLITFAFDQATGIGVNLEASHCLALHCGVPSEAIVRDSSSFFKFIERWKTNAS